MSDIDSHAHPGQDAHQAGPLHAHSQQTHRGDGHARDDSHAHYVAHDDPDAQAPVRIDPAGFALLVVDMQNGFCHPDGDIGRRGQGAPLQAVVPAVGRLVDLAHVAGGVTTNYCVDSTIRDAYARDFELVLVGDCCAALDQDLHDAVLRNTATLHGTVLTLDEVAAALGQTVVVAGAS